MYICHAVFLPLTRLVIYCICRTVAFQLTRLVIYCTGQTIVFPTNPLGCIVILHVSQLACLVIYIVVTL